MNKASTDGVSGETESMQKPKPWSGRSGLAAVRTFLAKGRHSCMSRPQTHVDNVSLALPTPVKVRQRDTRGDEGEGV